MKGLPLAIDLTRFSAAQVIQLCFGENEFQIHFDNNVRVVVESTIVFRDPSSDDVPIEKYGQAASLLCRVLGNRILLAARLDDGGLLLRFDSGTELHVLNDNVQFESFQVHVAGQTYVA